MSNSYFPLFYDITDWNICFFGAGAVAERRIKTLLKYPCKIYIISEKATKVIEEMAQKGTLIWIKEEIKMDKGKQQIMETWQNIKRKKQYQKYFLKEKDFQMVFACTNQREINQMIYEYCKLQGIRVNIADCRQQSDFYFPGLLKSEDFVIGVTGNGKNHKKVKQVMDKLRKLFC